MLRKLDACQNRVTTYKLRTLWENARKLDAHKKLYKQIKDKIAEYAAKLKRNKQQTQCQVKNS